MARVIIFWMIMLILWLLLVGISLGSFVNALVWRIYKQESITSSKRKAAYSIRTGRSMCSHCERPLAPKDLIPIVSWLALKGKCRYCRKPIPDTPLPEILVPALFLLSFAVWPHAFTAVGVALFIVWLAIVVCLVALFIYDLRWYMLPSRIIYPMAVLVALHVILTFIGLKLPVAQLWGVLWGMLAGGGLFWVLFQVSGGKWIGGGDVRLGLVYGALLGGPIASLLCLFIASIAGSLVSIPLLTARQLKMHSKLPFGPFLIIGIVAVYLFGASLVAWYKRQIGL